MQNILNRLNEKYHQCLVSVWSGQLVPPIHVLHQEFFFQSRSQELASLGIPGSDAALSASSVVSAEKIMYQHAIDLCQSAALDELFGNPQLCPKVSKEMCAVY